MHGFNFYTEAWIAYIALGLALLFLIDLKLRRLNFILRAAILTLISTGAFTPQMVSDADSYAPLILSSLLNAEEQGIDAIYLGLTTLLIVWGILLTVVLAIKYFVDARRTTQSTEQPNQ